MKKSRWQFYERAQREVYRKLKGRERPEAVVGAGWGLLDHFFIFLFSLGFFARIDFRPQRVKRVMIPTVLMILTYEMKQLTGISSMNQLEEHLFRDTALLKIIGFTARQIQEGFCERGKGKRRGPMHRDTLADFLSKFSSKEMDFILREAVRVLVKHKLIRGRTYILDATDLPTTKRYKGCGMKKGIKQVRSKDGQEVETVTYVYGYKLLVLMEARHKIIVAARVAKINEHEKNFIKELVREGQQRTGGAMKVLLVDRGFIDGVLLWWLSKKMGIKFVIPARSNMEVSQDIRGFRSEKADGQRIFMEQTQEMKVMGVPGLLSYDQFGEEEHGRKKGRKDFRVNPINGVMVLRWDGRDYEPGKEKVFLTNFSVSRPMKIIERYDLRSEIENQGFRELKQGYHLLKYPQKTEAAVRAHVVLTLIIYSLVNAYKSEQGQRLAHLGIRRWRGKQMGQSIHKMIVYYEGIYGIVDVEELFYLMDMTPKELYRLKTKQLQREIE
jgi:DDE family transposase